MITSALESLVKIKTGISDLVTREASGIVQTKFTGFRFPRRPPDTSGKHHAHTHTFLKTLDHQKRYAFVWWEIWWVVRSWQQYSWMNNDLLLGFYVIMLCCVVFFSLFNEAFRLQTRFTTIYSVFIPTKHLHLIPGLVCVKLENFSTQCYSCRCIKFAWHTSHALTWAVAVSVLCCRNVG